PTAWRCPAARRPTTGATRIPRSRLSAPRTSVGPACDRARPGVVLERAVADDSVLSEHVRRNRIRWDAEARNYAASGERAWARQEPTWGIWRVPESQLGVLAKDLAGKAGVE